MLTVQASKLYGKLYNDEQFKGSRGYIVNFIKRHNIRFLKITGEKLSNNAATVDAYIEQFAAIVRQKDLSASQIFNADESGLYFKSTPSSTFVTMDESSAPGRKGNKERVTFMPCSNADGSFKLPLMLIGKSKRPRALKNIHELPVYYASSKNAWMTRQLFKNWFFKEFVPKVTAFLEGAKLPVKAVLVLDNCSAHCCADELKTSDGAISTIFLPPNTTALLQPMDQNIIQMVKSNYKQKLMRELLGRQGEFDDMVKRINIKDAMFWVAEAWDAVPADSIVKSWKMLYTEPEIDDDDDIPLSVVRERILSIQQRLMEQDDIVHDEDVEFDILNDDDIVNIVLHPNTSFYDDENSFSTAEGANASSVLGPQQVDEDDESENCVSNETALCGIDKVITWAEENGLPLERQFLLRELRGNILEKMIDSRNVNI